MKNQNKEISRDLVQQISVDKLDAIIHDKSFTIIDVRGPKGIESQGEIPGAINVPFDTIDSAMNKHHEDFNSVFNNQGPFLICCTGGVMSYMAAIKLKKSGYKNCCNLDGGHSAWLKFNEKKSA